MAVLLRMAQVVVVGMAVIQDAMITTTDHHTEAAAAAAVMEVTAVQAVSLEAIESR